MRCALAKRTGWCGQCYATLKGRSAASSHGGTRIRPSERKAALMAGVRRPTVPDPGAPLPSVVLRGQFAEAHPNLAAFLRDTVYEDGSGRRTSTLTVFVEAGRVKLCLSDRDLNRTAWGTGDTLEDALAGLELALESGSADWRSSKGEPKKR